MRVFSQYIKITLLRFLRKLKVLKWIDLKLELTLNNQKFKVPIINEIGFNNHCMDEYWMLDLFRKFEIRDDDILIDMGANVGQTLLKWKAVNPLAPYIGIEPLPDCIDYLNQLTARNTFPGTQIFPYALTNVTGSGQIFMQYDDPTDRTATLVKNALTIKSKPIQTITFEDLLIKYDINPSKIRCIKIDVEGSEIVILGTMKSFLGTYHPILIVEVLSARQTNNQNNTEMFMRLVNELEYSLYRVVKSGYYLDHLQPVKHIDPLTEVKDSDYVMISNNQDNINWLKP